jgi:hypothetical protein
VTDWTVSNAKTRRRGGKSTREEVPEMTVTVVNLRFALDTLGPVFVSSAGASLKPLVVRYALEAPASFPLSAGEIEVVPAAGNRLLAPMSGLVRGEDLPVTIPAGTLLGAPGQVAMRLLVNQGMSEELRSNAVSVELITAIPARLRVADANQPTHYVEVLAGSQSGATPLIVLEDGNHSATISLQADRSTPGLSLRWSIDTAGSPDAQSHWTSTAGVFTPESADFATAAWQCETNCDARRFAVRVWWDTDGDGVAGEQEDVVQVPLVVGRVRLTSVDFTGPDNITLYKEHADWQDDLFGDPGHIPIDYPEWQAGDPKINEPVAYLGSSHPVTEIVFDVQPYDALLAFTLQMRDPVTAEALADPVSLVNDGPYVAARMVWNLKVGPAAERDIAAIAIETSPEGGSAVYPIASIEKVLWVVLGRPIEHSSIGSTNHPTSKRLNAVLTAIESTNGSDIDVIASTLQYWRDHAGIDVSGRTCCDDNLGVCDGDRIWGLLDTNATDHPKGQCREGSLLMEQALRLLGIDSYWEHVLATEAEFWNIGHTIRTVSYKGTTGLASHTPGVVYKDGKCVDTSSPEELWLWFSQDPQDNPFYGWNQGEGCARVGERLYTAFASQTVGASGGAAVSPEHSILLQLEGKSPNVQHWSGVVDGERYNRCQRDDLLAIEPIPRLPQ